MFPFSFWNFDNNSLAVLVNVFEIKTSKIKKNKIKTVLSCAYIALLSYDNIIIYYIIRNYLFNCFYVYYYEITDLSSNNTHYICEWGVTHFTNILLMWINGDAKHLPGSQIRSIHRKQKQMYMCSYLAWRVTCTCM